MRQLSDQEIARIQNRLRSLDIRYSEVYEEIFDHYCSTLENIPIENSKAEIAKLDETFSWSVVKGMDKSRQRFAKHHISQLQWNELKFWKGNGHNFFYLILTILILGLVYLHLNTIGMTLMVGIFSLVSLPIVWYSIGKNFTFSLKRFRFNYSNAFVEQIMNRSGIYYSGLYYFYIAFFNWDDSNPSIGGTIVSWLIITPLLLYMLSLIRVAWQWKQKQLQISSQ